MLNFKKMYDIKYYITLHYIVLCYICLFIYLFT